MWFQLFVSEASLFPSPTFEESTIPQVGKRVQSEDPTGQRVISPRPEDPVPRADISGLPWVHWAQSEVEKKNCSWSLFLALISVYNYTFISVIMWLISVSITRPSAQQGSLYTLLYAQPKVPNNSDSKIDGVMTCARQSSRGFAGIIAAFTPHKDSTR